MGIIGRSEVLSAIARFDRESVGVLSQIGAPCATITGAPTGGPPDARSSEFRSPLWGLALNAAGKPDVWAALSIRAPTSQRR